MCQKRGSLDFQRSLSEFKKFGDIWINRYRQLIVNSTKPESSSYLKGKFYFSQ